LHGNEIISIFELYLKQLKVGARLKILHFIMTTLNFKTKQEGYGRQGLYFTFDGEDYFIQSVFPNIKEGFGITHKDECFYDEEADVYRDCDGEETTPYSDLDTFLLENFKEDIGRILFESLDRDKYDFNLENSSYLEIAEWAGYY